MLSRAVAARGWRIQGVAARLHPARVNGATKEEASRAEASVAAYRSGVAQEARIQANVKGVDRPSETAVKPLEASQHERPMARVRSL